ncbi:MAG TPA: YdcF family protein, partial [Polyangiaceae bacterium]
MNRIADVAFEPLWWAALALVCTYALRRRAPRFAAALPAIAGAVLVFFSIPAVGNGLVRALEQPVLSSAQPGVVYDAVIVLGGAMSLEVSADTGQPAFGDPVERVLTGFELLRSGRAKNAILSGGPGAGQVSEARMMAQQLAAWGIDDSRLALEERSENTHENAVGSVA